MLVVRRNQLAAIDRERKEQTLRAAVRLVEEEAPGAAAAAGGRERLEARVRGAVQRAREVGLAAPWDQCRFALFSVALGERFDEELDWARAVMRDEALTGTQRMDAMEIVWRNYYARRDGGAR